VIRPTVSPGFRVLGLTIARGAAAVGVGPGFGLETRAPRPVVPAIARTSRLVFMRRD